MGTRFKIGWFWKSFSVGSIVGDVVVVATVSGLVLMVVDEVVLENNFKVDELWQNERFRRIGEHVLILLKYGWDALNILGDVTMTLLNILFCWKETNWIDWVIDWLIDWLIAGNIFFLLIWIYYAIF